MTKTAQLNEWIKNLRSWATLLTEAHFPTPAAPPEFVWDLLRDEAKRRDEAATRGRGFVWASYQCLSCRVVLDLQHAPGVTVADVVECPKCGTRLTLDGQWPADENGYDPKRVEQANHHSAATQAAEVSAQRASEQMARESTSGLGRQPPAPIDQLDAHHSAATQAAVALLKNVAHHLDKTVITGSTRAEILADRDDIRRALELLGVKP